MVSFLKIYGKYGTVVIFLYSKTGTCIFFLLFSLWSNCLCIPEIWNAVLPVLYFLSSAHQVLVYLCQSSCIIAWDFWGRKSTLKKWRINRYMIFDLQINRKKYQYFDSMLQLYFLTSLFLEKILDRDWGCNFAYIQF